jgi:hypothetical protein
MRSIGEQRMNIVAVAACEEQTEQNRHEHGPHRRASCITTARLG